LATYEKENAPSDESDVDKLLAPYRTAIEEALRGLRGRENKLDGLANEFLESGGKRLRPSIVLLACESVMGSYENAMPIALAYELAHSASLTQDDIIDDSPTRHNKPTAHVKHGLTTAILISDMLIFKIFEQLSRYADIELSKKRLSMLIDQVAIAAEETAEGEFLEMELTKKTEVTMDEYVRLARLKTGALLGASAASGAIVAGAGPRIVKDMQEYGRNLGIAFQLMDDILDITGESEVMGKPMLKDVQNNAANIVLVHALLHADPKTRNRIRSMMVRSTYGLVDVMELLGVLDDLGSVEYATSLCRKHAAIARGRLKHLPEGNPRRTLEQLTTWLEARRR
jgi:geranylgeranyl diphosphate synthase type I